MFTHILSRSPSCSLFICPSRAGRGLWCIIRRFPGSRVLRYTARTHTSSSYDGFQPVHNPDLESPACRFVFIIRTNPYSIMASQGRY
ncbi:hypothetical protein VTP01DRAFT_9864 [Rhizomucor pusillus]|uniref:uncharacterized protein n=1 Tax=Rhizomucor pusillus TaxID=4840 RepID=UPI00374396DC